jgi:uncharacterized protein (DUF2147 family)
MNTIRRPITQIAAIMILLLSIARTSMAQADGIEGVWFNDKKDAKIKIFKSTDGKFYGQIIWIKEPLKDGQPKLDDKNPKSALKSRPIVGMIILKGCEKDGANTYDDGTIYDPENGKTYDCKITNKGSTLNLRGYIGVSLFGRTTQWERTTI